MVDVLARVRTALFGNREERLSIPIMDGALKPNNLLEQAEVFASRPGLEDIAAGPDGTLYAACGDGIHRVAADGAFTELARFDRDVTALAVLGNGSLAVALGSAVLIDAAGAGRRVIDSCDGQQMAAVNALSATPEGSLLICDGSATRPYPQWSHDLLESGRSGRLLEHQPATGRTTTLAAGLSYSFGALVDEQRRILVSESWRHRLMVVAGETSRPAVAGLPGYPARLAPAAGGGFWLSVFACRTQLVEFVLCEDDFRRDMMRTVDPRYWVAPALSSGEDFLEPLQGGGVKQMGILKPWAPPRSYGLVIRFGADFIPRYSLHSRVGGRNHGIVAVAERDNELYVLSKGAGRILRLPVPQAGEGLEP